MPTGRCQERRRLRHIVAEAGSVIVTTRGFFRLELPALGCNADRLRPPSAASRQALTPSPPSRSFSLTPPHDRVRTMSRSCE